MTTAEDIYREVLMARLNNGYSLDSAVKTASEAADKFSARFPGNSTYKGTTLDPMYLTTRSES